MIIARKAYDAALADYENDMHENLERIGFEEQELMQSIGEFYKRKEGMLSDWSKRFARISKVGFGGSVAAWVAQAVQNLFEQVPVLRDMASWILPAVATGMIALSAAFKFVLPWHLQTVKNRLPIRESQRRIDAAERMENRRREEKEILRKRKEFLDNDLVAKHEKIAERMRQAYSDLLPSYGYVSPN